MRKGFFTFEQFTALRLELPEHLRPVITFAYYTVCRKGEILALQWSQVDTAARLVRLEPGDTKNDNASRPAHERAVRDARNAAPNPRPEVADVPMDLFPIWEAPRRRG